MIQNPLLVDEFKKAQIKASRPDYFRNLRVFEGLYREANALGVFPLKDPLEGIEVDIRLAGVLNVQKAS
ncbi:MAG: hypothetical protein H8E10_19160 [Desulfobacterales bacterium]|nr:hypothetical protein [Desulfobacterales bacterium]MBU0734848.1 hypothetical protein [Pseudomonadota bacterium]MBU1932140.1 hypothetical protein [Patescibacteria group bacterium]